MKMRQLSVAACFALVAGTAILHGAANDADTSKATLERQLSAARKARVESAQKAFDTMQAAFRAETVTFDGLVDAIRNLVEAEVDAASKPQDEIAAWSRYVKMTKQAEAYTIGMSNGGEGPAYETAKQERQRAEIALLKAQIKAKP